MIGSRPLTGAWIETSTRPATPSRPTTSPPHGGVDRNDAEKFAEITGVDVAPSRGRGSKQPSLLFRPTAGASPPHGGVDRNGRGGEADHPTNRRPLTGAWIETHLAAESAVRPGCRPLTGAWIETAAAREPPESAWCRPLTGAWIETLAVWAASSHHDRRPLTGAWIETCFDPREPSDDEVAPSRGRGSKRDESTQSGSANASPPHGGVDRNSSDMRWW